MTLDLTKIRVGVSGAIWKGASGATAPTTTTGSPASHTDLGYVSDDGVEIQLPDAGDTTPIKAWQGGVTVRTIRTPSDDLPTWKLVLLETKLEVVEAYFGVTVTTGVSEGSFVYTVAQRSPFSWVVDVIDGAELIRDYIPRGVVASVEAQTFSNGDPIGYGITIEGELDPVKAYNFKRFATALKT